MTSPTFKESKQKRPVHRRLTPVAWALIAVIALACVGCGVAGGAQVTPFLLPPGGDGWAAATPTPTALAPTATKGPTATPKPVPTLEPTPPFPAWWASQMEQDEKGQWWPPAEVVEMVKEAWDGHNETTKKYLVDTKPPDYDAYEEAARLYYAGPQLEIMLSTAENRRAGEVPIVAGEYEICALGVQEFTPDGLACTMSIACRNGAIGYYDPLTGELQQEYFEALTGLSVSKMVYDPNDGHWKWYDLVLYVPPEKLEGN